MQFGWNSERSHRGLVDKELHVVEKQSAVEGLLLMACVTSQSLRKNEGQPHQSAMTPMALDYIVLDRFKWSGMHCSTFGHMHRQCHQRQADEMIMWWQRWCDISKNHSSNKKTEQSACTSFSITA